MSVSCSHRADLENLVLMMLESGTRPEEIKSEIEEICEMFAEEKVGGADNE